MTDFYFDGDLVGADPGDGSQGNPWKLLSHLRAQTGDNHRFFLVGDFRDQIPGTNGFIEVGGNNWTVLGSVRNGLKPKIGTTQQAKVNLTSVAISSTTVTVDTASAHGLVVNDTVLLSGITGAAVAANGFWQVVTQPSATRFTITLGTASSGTSTNGTVERAANSVAAFYNSSRTGFDVSVLDVSRVRYVMRKAGTGVTGNRVAYVDSSFIGQYVGSGSGSSSGSIYEWNTTSGVREDCYNWSGSTNADYIVRYCTAIYIGYCFDLATPTTDMGTGPGDFCTNHAGSGASNYGTVHHCSASYGTQGFFNNVNTSGTSIAYDNFVSEFAGSGFQQSGGGSMICWNNLYVAPVNQALDNTSSRGMFKFNPASGVGGTFQCYFNTGYTAKGTISSFTTAAAMFIVSGGITNGASDQFIFKGNRWLSNGTAPFAQVVNQNSVSITNLVLSGGTATVTANSHGLSVGCRVRIIGVTGGAAAINNQTLTVATVIDANRYTAAFGGSGTSTNGSSQRVPMLVCNYNVYSGNGSEVLFSYGAASASYSGTSWKSHYDANSVFGGSIQTIPPTVVDSFRVPSGGLLSALSASALATATGQNGINYDYDDILRSATPDLGAFQSPRLKSAFGGMTGFFDAVCVDLP